MIHKALQSFHEKHQHHRLRILVVALLLLTFLWMSSSHKEALRKQDDVFNGKIEEHRKKFEAEKDLLVKKLYEKDASIKTDQLHRRQLSINLLKKLDETESLRQQLDIQQRMSKEQADEMSNVKGNLTLAVPKKRDIAPSEEEIDAALVVVMDMLQKERFGSSVEAIAVIGGNIEPMVARLQKVTPNVTILGGETSNNSEALENLHKRFTNDMHKFFEIDEAHPVPSIRSALATGSVDALIVWDLDNKLNAALAYKSLTYEASRVLRTRTGPRSAIFVAGQKQVSFTGEQVLRLQDTVPSSNNSHLFSVHVLERGAAVRTKSRWHGLSGMKAVAPLEFLNKCRTPQEHMYGLDVLLRIVADALEECGITYWLDSVTLLGAYRFNAYSPMAADHRVVVDQDEFMAQTVAFRKLIGERFEEINRQPHFMAVDEAQLHMSQLTMSKDGSTGPQINLIPAKWDGELSKYMIQAEQTYEGFQQKVLFSNKTSSKWKTKHGYLRSLPILGREYPAPYDVEGYSAVWHSKSNFMNFIVLRQLKDNKKGHAVYCRDSYAKVFAPKDVSAVRKMVARMKELFPMTFSATSCPLCK